MDVCGEGLPSEKVEGEERGFSRILCCLSYMHTKRLICGYSSCTTWILLRYEFITSMPLQVNEISSIIKSFCCAISSKSNEKKKKFFGATKKKRKILSSVS